MQEVEQRREQLPREVRLLRIAEQVNRDLAERGGEQGVYRIGFFVVLVLAIALGLLVGTLNHEVVVIDLFWVQLHWPMGLSLLSAIAIGLLIGLSLAWLFSVLPLRMRLRKARHQKNGASPLSDSLDA